MPSYSKDDIILVRLPFSDLSGSKIRPAVIVNAEHISKDFIIVPLNRSSSTHDPDLVCNLQIRQSLTYRR
jgi:mRNA interferase MazF